MKFFHIDWSPQTRWGYRVVSRLNNSLDPTLKDRTEKHWPAEQMIAFATKLALLRVTLVRFNEDVRVLSGDLEKKAVEIQKCIPGHKALLLANPDLAFRLVAGIDGFIYEMRSAYEILGSVLRLIVGTLGMKVDETALRKVLEAKAHDTRWIDELRDIRIEFFHHTSPWIAIEVTDENPPYQILVLRKNSYDLETEVQASFPLRMLDRFFCGFE